MDQEDQNNSTDDLRHLLPQWETRSTRRTNSTRSTNDAKLIEAGNKQDDADELRHLFPRWETQSQINPGSYESESVDFVSILTYASHLYTQNGVLEMRDTPPGEQDVSGRGALSTVTRLDTTYTQPSVEYTLRVDEKKIEAKAKRYHTGIWDENGRPHPGRISDARKLLVELRILCHPDLRAHENIVTILGLEWDSLIGTPQPVILLESADWDLLEFLKKYPELPLSTKWRLAHDVASGLDALHSHGVIHGDLKPSNVVVFASEPYQAKLIDFSHSIIEPSKPRKLNGGTTGWAAPEWELTMNISSLKLTDVYSYGLVFASIIAGRDIVTKFRHDVTFSKERNQLPAYPEQDNTMLTYVTAVIRNLEDPNIENVPKLIEILNLTIQKDPKCRDLGKVLEKTSEIHAHRDKPAIGGFNDGIAPIELSIPYQALFPLNGNVQRYIINVLKMITEDTNRYMSSAAAFELAICYATGFGIAPSSEMDHTKSQCQSLTWLTKAAQNGDLRARLTFGPMHQAFGYHVPDNIPLTEWLEHLVLQRGCESALDSLATLDQSSHSKVAKAYRQKYCGNKDSVYSNVEHITEKMNPSTIVTERQDTLLHYAASTTKIEIMDIIRNEYSSINILNERNLEGDTALIQAARAGHSKVINILLDQGADPKLRNKNDETVLHYLVNLDPGDVKDVAWNLVRCGAGTELQTVAKGSCSKSFLSLRAIHGGSAALRAVCCNNATVLQVLFEIEDYLINNGYPDLKTSQSALLRLASSALKFHHIDVLETIDSRLESETDLNIRIWDDGHLRNLLEICIWGPVSSSPLSGFDWPEPFTRIIRFGSRYREVLCSCLDFLVRRGVRIHDNKYKNVLDAIKSERIHAVAHLGTHLVDTYGDPLRSPTLEPWGLAKWMHVAIQYHQTEIIYNLLQLHYLRYDFAPLGNNFIKKLFPCTCMSIPRKYQPHNWMVPQDLAPNYTLLYTSLILQDNSDETLLHILLKWLRQPNVPKNNLWVPRSTDEHRLLERYAMKSIENGFCPLYLAAEQLKYDVVALLIDHGASFQDAFEEQTIMESIIRKYNTSEDLPDVMGQLIQIAILRGSKNIITISNIVELVLSSDHVWTPSRSKRIETILIKSRYETRIQWTTPERGSTSLLEWKDPGIPASKYTYRMWAFIFKACTVQRPQITADTCPDLLPNILLHATIQSNWAMVHCLLDLGFDAEGSGELGYGSEQADVYTNWIFTPLDFVEWTEAIPNAYLSQSGIDFKQQNRAIADLIKERGGRKSRLYNPTYQFLILPFQELMEVAIHEYHHSNFESFLGFLFLIPAILACNWLARNLRDLGSLFLWLIPSFMSLLFGIILFNLLVQAVFQPIRAFIWGPKRTAQIHIVHGGSSRAFWAAMFGERYWFNKFCVRMLGFPAIGRDLEDSDVLLDLLIEQETEHQLMDEYDEIVSSKPNEEWTRWKIIEARQFQPGESSRQKRERLLQDINPLEYVNDDDADSMLAVEPGPSGLFGNVLQVWRNTTELSLTNELDNQDFLGSAQREYRDYNHVDLETSSFEEDIVIRQSSEDERANDQRRENRILSSAGSMTKRLAKSTYALLIWPLRKVFEGADAVSDGILALRERDRLRRQNRDRT